MGATFVDRMSTLPAFALCFLAYHLLAVVMGLGAALLLLPGELKRDSLAFAPVLGFCVLVALGWRFMFLGPPGTDRYWPWLLLIGAGLTAAGCVARRRELRRLLGRDLLCLSASAAIGAAFLAAPMARQPHLTVLSAFNNDPANYTAVERITQRVEGEPPRPEDQYRLVEELRNSVTGAFLGTAVLGSALGVPVFQLQQVCVAVYLFWGALLAGLFALRVLRFGRPGAMVVSLVSGLASFTLFTAWNGFKSQFAGMAIFLALLVVLVPALEDDRAGPPSWRLPAAITLALGLALTYPHMVLLAWAVLGAVGAAHALRRRSWRWLGRAALLLAAVLAGAAALSPERARTVLHYTLYTARAENGWFSLWISPLTFLGLSENGLTSTTPYGWGELAVGILVLGGLLVWGARRSLPADRPALATAAAILVSVSAGYLALCITGQQRGVLGGYKPYKLLSFFYPAALAPALLGFRELAVRWGTWRERGALGAAAALVAGVAVTSAGGVRRMRDTPYVVTPELASLQSLESDDRVESINLVSPRWWDSMWQTAFLLRKRLYQAHQTYYPRSERLLGQWTLVEVSPPDPVLRWEPGARVLPVGPAYQLVEGTDWVEMQYGAGWHGAEPGHRWTSDQQARVRIQSPGARAVTLELQYAHRSPEATLEVLLGERLLGRCERPDLCAVGPFDLPAGQSDLVLADSRPPASPGPSDPRLLGTSYSLIKLASVPAGAEADPR
ncbi:MAG TPA: hypothetical protein VND93_02545 [Myxococcales bacterium]|nr:hypothetical protein [Myxococcales bacterium]